MNKILVTVYVLCLETQYDLLIPINLTIKDSIDLIQQAICELTSNSYKKNVDALLYDENGKIINYNNIVKFSGLKNGSKVMLI